MSSLVVATAAVGTVSEKFEVKIERREEEIVTVTQRVQALMSEKESPSAACDSETKMKPLMTGSVIDSVGTVYGVKNLRIKEAEPK